MENQSEVKRVLNNPENVILSDSLREILGENVSNAELPFLGEIKFGENVTVTGSIVFLEIDSTAAKVTIKTSRAEALKLSFCKKPIEVIFKITDSDYILEGNIHMTNIVSLIESSKVELLVGIVLSEAKNE